MENKVAENNMKIVFDSRSENESLARVAVAAFVTRLDPTLEEINDIKTAVSEAVTNAIIHGYEEGPGNVTVICHLKSIWNEQDKNTYNIESKLTVTVKDEGVGIEDIERAMEPTYTSKSEMERSGMGFVFMNLFMDSVTVQSEKGNGTIVIMTKKLKRIKKQG